MSDTTTTTTTKSDQTTTTTTNGKPETTTTTTTQGAEAHDAPSGDRASANFPGGEASPNAERQGEVRVDKHAETDIVGGTPSENGAAQDDADTQAQNMEDAKAEGLRNAARERQAQPGQPDRDKR